MKRLDRRSTEEIPVTCNSPSAPRERSLAVAAGTGYREEIEGDFEESGEAVPTDLQPPIEWRAPENMVLAALSREQIRANCVIVLL